MNGMGAWDFDCCGAPSLYGQVVSKVVPWSGMSLPKHMSQRHTLPSGSRTGHHASYEGEANANMLHVHPQMRDAIRGPYCPY